MDWKTLWLSIFNTTEWQGLNMGFWVSMGVVTLLVVIMNIVFWSIKPKKKNKENPEKKR